MDFDLTPEQAEFRDVVRRFAEEVVAPRAAEADEAAELPMDVVKRMAELGLFGLPFPEEHGGSDADTVTVCLAIEELGRVDQSIGITLSAAVGLGGTMVHRFGSPAQQERWLGPIARGEILASFALTEPGGGTDAAAARTTATLDGDTWVIDGTKAFITNCGTEISGLHVVAAATEPGGGTHGLSTFLVPADTPGITVAPPYRKMGWHASDTHELVLQGVRVPQDALLGERGRGYPQCLSILVDGRISVAALAVGCAQACLDLAVAYASDRETFGRPIGANQAIQSKLADMQVATEAARLLTYRAAWLKDQARRTTAISSSRTCTTCSSVASCSRSFAALYHWTPLVNGRAFSERLSRWVFGLMFIGFNLAFFPMHVAGLLGMPRRVHSYDGGLGWTASNALSSLGALVLAIGVALFVFDALRTWRRPHRDHENPWQAPTLEWLPNDVYGARSIPQVTSRDPLWSRPELAQEVEAGRHWLPGTTSGGRETLVTTPRAARLSHLIVLPGDSWRPLLAAIGTAGFFLLLTVKLMLPALVFGALAVGASIAWLWETDAPPHAPQVAVGHRVTVPVGARGWRSHGWWAALILVVVDATVWASLLFAHVHVSMRAAVCPPPGASLPAAGRVAAAVGSALASSAAIALVQRLSLAPSRGARVRATLGVLVAMLALAASVVCITLGHEGLTPKPMRGARPSPHCWPTRCSMHSCSRCWRSTWSRVHGAAGCCPDSRASLDNIALLWHASVAQAVAGALAVQWLPGLMR